MDRAVEAFENDFARWDLHLPPDAVEARRAGHVQHAGWSVLFNFGRDVRGDYLDYYASPRDVTDDPPGDDWHVRLYASGERISLPTVLEAYMYGRDPTWEELERARRPFAGQPAESLGETARADSAAPEDEVAPAVPPPSRLGGQARQPDRAGSSPLGAGTEPRAKRVVPSKDGVDLDLGGLEAEASQNYLPIDIGLDIELNLSALRGTNDAEASEPPAWVEPSIANEPPEAVEVVAPASTRGPMDAPEPVHELEGTDAVDPVDELEPADALDAVDALEPMEAPEPVDDPEPFDAAGSQEQVLPERFYSAEDSTPLVAARSEVSPLATLPLLDVESDPDDRPAPITLGVVPEVPETRASGQTVVHPAAPEAIETVPVETSDEAIRPRPSDDTVADGADDAAETTDEKEVPSSVPTWESEFPEAAALTGPIRSRPKVFPRADIVLTADVATIDGGFDSDSFLPWWHRPGARRIAAALAAVVVVALIALAATHHRSRPGPEQGDADDPDSAASVAGPAFGSPNADSASNGDSAASAPSQSIATPAGNTSPSDSTPEPATSTQAEAPPTSAADGVDRGSEEGMARPAGPQSISPIQPSASHRTRSTSVKSPPGSMPRAQ